MSKDAPGFWRRLWTNKGAEAEPTVEARPAVAAIPLPSPESTGKVEALATPAPRSATTISRYRRERELGRGSMGVVYLATDLQTQREVALKQLALQREFSPEDLQEVRQRFLREARAAGALHHPDILEVVDAGEAGADAWIAMELVRGHDLSAHTRLGQLLPVPTVLRVTARVARALAYAHRQGVVHRDIKPANVMVDLASDSVKLTDFGIARIADGSRTRTGLVLGTPSFMSPEQLAGLRVDGRSDLYSLGVLLFQLLCGQLPHQAESMAKLMYQIANEAAADIRTLRPDLPESLAHVVALALEKRPELRYATGDALADDLDALLAQMPEPQRPLAPGVHEQSTLHADSHNVDSFAQTQALQLGDPGHNRQPS